MSEADYQWDKYIDSIGHGCEFDPPVAQMKCVEDYCGHQWPSGLEADFDGGEPVAVPILGDCPKCGSDATMLTDHDVTHYA